MTTFRDPEVCARAVAARRNREVDLAPLREAFEVSGRSAADVARAMGWFCTNKFGGRGKPQTVADGPRVRRALGLRPEQTKAGYPPALRQRCSYEMAVRLAHAIGVDPHEVGL